MPIKESPSTLVTCTPDGVDNKDESSALMSFQVSGYVLGRGLSRRACGSSFRVLSRGWFHCVLCSLVLKSSTESSRVANMLVSKICLGVCVQVYPEPRVDEPVWLLW